MKINQSIMKINHENQSINHENQSIIQSFNQSIIGNFSFFEPQYRSKPSS